MKRLLNSSEQKTNAVLKPLTERWGAHAFPKVRLADVLPIENSGLSDERYRFALQAHFDFLVTDDELQPLFAVEFDGESHKSEIQKLRDSKKDELCDRFGLPILRINSKYIGLQFRQMDLLSWFVNYWFAQKAIAEAYESGQIPSFQYVDPMSVLTLPGFDSQFPMCLSADVRMEFHRLFAKREITDPAPSTFVGVDSSGAYRAISYLAVTPQYGLVTETGMRCQRFKVPCSDVLDAIVEHQIFDELERLRDANRMPDSIDQICERLAWHIANCTVVKSLQCSQLERLRSAT